MAKRFWLLKTEPGDFSIDDLERDRRTRWTGVRNFQARNLIRDEMSEGDEVLFYHSSAAPPGVVGLARVASPPYPDPLAERPDSPYYDEKHTRAEPRWYAVDVEFREKFSEVIPLGTLKETPELEGMLVTRRSRLSVQPVSAGHFEHVRRMGRGL